MIRYLSKLTYTIYIQNQRKHCVHTSVTVAVFYQSRDGIQHKISVSGSVNVGFSLGSSSMELGGYFLGGRLSQINCNCKYQLTDGRQTSQTVLIIIRLQYLKNLVSLSKVKYLIYCETCERTYNFIQ